MGKLTAHANTWQSVLSCVFRCCGLVDWFCVFFLFFGVGGTRCVAYFVYFSVGGFVLACSSLTSCFLFLILSISVSVSRCGFGAAAWCFWSYYYLWLCLVEIEMKSKLKP